MKTLPIVASLLLTIVVVVGIYAGEKLSMPPSDTNINIPPTDDTRGIIRATKTSSGTRHIYEGVIALPTPCHKLSIDTTIAESYPEQITLNFYTTPGDGICAQVITEREFKIEFDAHQDHALHATRNSVPVDIQIIPVQTKEDIDMGNIELMPL